MKKLNNKGFAISTMIYGTLILFVIIMSLLISTLNFRYRSLSDIASKAEKQKGEYFLNIGIKLYTYNDIYTTPFSGTYIFSYIGKDEENQDVEKECSVYIEKGSSVKHNGNILEINEKTIDNCDFEESSTIIINSIKTTEKITEDISGANMPDTRNGLVPVKYDEGINKWVITSADDPDWYDYSKQKWANAVSLDSTNTGLYENGKPRVGAPLNLPIDSDIDNENDIDVLAMFVWIPRYSYTIGCADFDGNNGINTGATERDENKNILSKTECLGYKIAGASEGRLTTANPGAINIKFISTNKKDNFPSDFPIYTYEIDENYMPKANVNPTNWYTHPAFTFEGKELSGIWVGKFETSTSVDNICYSSESKDNCNNNNQNPRILPNVKSLRNQNLYNQYNTAKKFSVSDNIYNLSGSSRVMKNSEWGAVAYLSQSIYGKYGNPAYEKEYKEIYINNSSSRITGRSSGDIPRSGAATAAGTCIYNASGNDRVAGTGECGPGASTTGNIYGIYDMVGGSMDVVLAWYKDNRSNFGDYLDDNDNSIYNKTGFSASNGFPSETESDIYIYSRADKVEENIGHGESETLSWHDAEFMWADENYPVICRSGLYSGVGTPESNKKSIGIFYSDNIRGTNSGNYSFRTVLINE